MGGNSPSREKKEIHSRQKEHQVLKKTWGQEPCGQGGGSRRVVKYGGQFAAPQPAMDSESLSVLPQDLPDSPFPPQGAPRPCWTSQAWISILRAPPTQPCPPALVTRPALSNPAPPYPCLMMSSCLWVRKGPGPEGGGAAAGRDAHHTCSLQSMVSSACQSSLRAVQLAGWA